MAAFERCQRCEKYRQILIDFAALEDSVSPSEAEKAVPMACCVAHSLPQVTIEEMKDVRPHPNAHSLDVAMVGQHRVVTGRHYAEGQYGYFIPEGAVVPDLLAEEMELKGLLDGPNRNVVKARKMRGILSEGLFYGFGLNGSHDPAQPWEAGKDVTSELGVSFTAL